MGSAVRLGDRSQEPEHHVGDDGVDRPRAGHPVDMSRLGRPLGTVRWIAHQVVWGIRSVSDCRSLVRYTSDVILYHILDVIALPWADNERHIRLKDGTDLTYRLNRGDSKHSGSVGG